MPMSYRRWARPSAAEARQLAQVRSLGAEGRAAEVRPSVVSEVCNGTSMAQDDEKCPSLTENDGQH